MIRPLVLATVMLLTPPAHGHDWFKGKSDPVTNWSCCGGNDCKEVPEEMLVLGVIQEVQGGYLVQLTGAQAQFFNGSKQPIRQMIPWARVQPSETMTFAICIVGSDVRCFFAPQTS